MDPSHCGPQGIGIDPWEEMKPHIEQLWLIQKLKLPRVVQEMKDKHNFDAVEHQYKHHFKKWQWKKNVPKAKMDQITQQIESRARAGKPGTNITLQGRPVEDRKIRRYLKSKARLDSQSMELKRFSNNEGPDSRGPVLAFTSGIFLRWNMPFEAMVSTHRQFFDQPSPYSPSVRSPGSDIIVATPPSAASPRNGPSSIVLIVKEGEAIARARLFAQGQHNELLAHLNGEERRQMSDWLYQYWFYCFKTAKQWGKGPTAWTAELLDFESFKPSLQSNTLGTQKEMLVNDAGHSQSLYVPTDLCRWFVHLYDWEGFEEAEPHDDELPWPVDQQQPPLPARLRNALEHNDFSPSPTASLPVAIPSIAKAAERSPNELLLESLGFSIISRNINQVQDIIAETIEKDIEYGSIYPLHMATAYLNGADGCCDVLSMLDCHLTWQERHEIFVNELGHTVWDSLMSTILKSHSSAGPAVVDEAWRETKRFPGEEVDICGRWDADSPAYRRLLASGESSIPFAWKHKFCHTSAQAICHCIIMLSTIMLDSVFWKAPSGLYIRRCFHCGAKLQLYTLHSLVMTAYHLANNSCQEEDLFGILAYLLCFIAEDLVHIGETANLSVTALMEADTLECQCDHEDLTAAGLAERISSHSTVQNWDEKVQTGWAVFCGVLRRSEDAEAEADMEPLREDVNERLTSYSLHGEDNEAWYDEFVVSEDEHMEMGTDPAGICDGQMDTRTRTKDLCYRHDAPEDDYEAGAESFRMRPDLASLWAATQAEMILHRRLKEDMGWTSVHFPMDELRDQLTKGLPLSVGYHEEALLKPHCPCGRFDCGPLATLLDVIDPDIDTEPNPETRLIKVECDERFSRAKYGIFFLDEHENRW